MIAYGARVAVSNVPHGSVNSGVSGTGTEADGEVDGEADADREEAAADVPRPSGTSFPEGTMITNAATATRIAAPRKAMSQRTFRTLPFS
ncbi:hypothetical protein GCM10017559_19890 [Streptosporangium longisporum]|uniref:Uncharacterized protein n=1 Tax=Streptosporangium longisporum TaxID=46187 RepID=A0ABN3XVX2_9ACTN